ncbi:MAG: 4-(cytidine 5'-diphospho)-2-C-methyl-D-erythritol kinase [Dehalococcoidia bacterium]|nr:MAG: 4-(cytidine 5'-diphospho)-2-C-methyl-D-erythritol kinase [Dehalococcoidia bacterium]
MEGAMENLCSLFKKIIVLTVYAPAKINLVLEVLGKNNDYHLISSIVQSIDLCDVLNFQLDEEICFECAEPSLNRDNLVIQAATLLKESTKYTRGARIELRKHIPWAVGLGGGSSDAAATFLALNELWGLALSLSELVHLASKLGSDVPFFIHKGTALVEGKGEKITPLPSLPSTCFVLLVPSVPKILNKTKQMYNNLDAAYFTEGQFVQKTLSSLRQGKAIDPGLMFNVFRKVAFDFFPGLDKYRKTLEEAGAPGVYLAGSGPCLFTFFVDERKARELFSQLKKQGLECYLASSFPHTNVAAGL